MKILAVLIALSFFPFAASAGEIVKRDVRYKRSGPITSQYVFQATGSRRGSTLYTRDSRSYRRPSSSYYYSTGNICYPYGGFRSYYPAHYSTRVTVIRRPVSYHYRPAVRVSSSYRSYRPVSYRCR